MARRPGYIYALGFGGDGSLLTNVVTSNVSSATVGQLAVYTDPVTIGGTPSVTFSDSVLHVQGDLTLTGNITSIVGDGSRLSNTCDVPGGTYGTGTAIPQVTVSQDGRLESIQLNKVTLSLDDVVANGNHTANASIDNLTSDTVTAQTIYADGKNIRNIVDAFPGTYGSSTLIPQIIISDDGRIDSIQNASFCLNLDDIATFNNKTINYFEFNNSIGIQGNVNFSGTLSSLTARTPGMTLSFDDWDTIRMGVHVQTLTPGTQVSDFKWYVSEDETDVQVTLPTSSTPGTWIGFTNLSVTSNIILSNCTVIPPATDQAGVARRMLRTQNRWICS